MSTRRYLFVTCDAGGNLQPELVLATRLRDRGHDVRVLAQRSQQAAVEAAGLEFRGYRTAPEWDWNRPDTAPLRDWELRPLQEFAALRDRVLFGPSSAFAADVLDELDAEPADVLVVDSFLFGAMAAAERSGLPSAVLWHTTFSRSDCDTPPEGAGLPPAERWPGKLRDRAIKAVENRLWLKGLPALNEARDAIGLSPLDSVHRQLDRMDRVLVMTSPSFDVAVPPGGRFPGNVRYVGPQLELGAPSSQPRDRSETPLVLVSASTSYQGQEHFLDRVITALGTLPVRVLVTTGHAVTITAPTPANVEIATWVPHSTVLPDADLVVTHGGHGTVMASLAHGVPVVCLPMGRDQPDIAARVAHRGVGVRLPPKASPRRIAQAVRDVLADEHVGKAAGRLAEDIRRELAPDPGVEELERLAAASGIQPAPSSET